MKHSTSSLIVSLCLGLSACDRGPVTLEIGMIVAQSGVSGARGKDLVDGAVLAADEINHAGFKVDGRPLLVKLVPTDDQGDVAHARRNAQDLVDAGVNAVIGPLNTNQGAAVVPVIAAGGIPQLITATGASLTGLGKGNVLRLLANDNQQGRAMAVFAADTLHAQRVGLIIEDSEYGRGLSAAFAAASASSPVRPVASIRIADTAKVDMDAVNSFRAAKVDIIVLFGREIHLTSLLAGLDTAGWKDVKVLGSNVIRNKQVAQRDIHIDGLYASATAIDAQEFPDGRTFLAAFRSRFGSDPVWGAQYSYDAVYALADAARQAGGVGGAELVSTLKRIDPASKVNQQMRFAPSGEQVYPNVAVYKVANGAWEVQQISAIW